MTSLMCGEVTITSFDRWSLASGAALTPAKLLRGTLSECKRLLTRTLVDSVLHSGASKGNVMVGRSLVIALVLLVCVAALVAPILVDARHWWPRKPKL